MRTDAGETPRDAKVCNSRLMHHVMLQFEIAVLAQSSRKRATWPGEQERTSIKERGKIWGCLAKREAAKDGAKNDIHHLHRRSS
jgi:hypothetical protein